MKNRQFHRFICTSRPKWLRDEAERAIKFSRVEHALKVYTKVLEIEIRRLKSGESTDKSRVSKIMEKPSFSRKIGADPRVWLERWIC